MTLDLAPTNTTLWAGCEVVELAGKATLRTPPEEAISHLAANLRALPIDPDEVTLTGSMAIWAYLVAFHALHGRTRHIYYQDGRGTRVLVAAHG